MELYQLNTFVAVAKAGHLTRAAKALHTSQPAVSAHIKALEEELGVQLFERTPKGMCLTQAGEQLQAQALKILDSIRDMKSQAQMFEDQPAGIVKLGLNIDPGFLKLNRLLSYSRSRFPKIEYHLIQHMTWEAIDAVETGMLDGAFVYGGVDSERLNALRLKQMPVVIVAPISMEKEIKNAGWDTLGALPWITTPKNCRFHDISTRIFKEHNIKPVTIAVADEESTIRQLVVSGAGVTLMIRQEAQSLENDKKVVVWNREVAALTLFFIYAKKQGKDKKIQAVVEAVSKVWDLI